MPALRDPAAARSGGVRDYEDRQARGRFAHLLASSLRLFVRQILIVVDGHCPTESYEYRLQRDDARQSWLIRWEYLRNPPRPEYAYPAAQVHVDGEWERAEALDRLRIPTRRMPLELVVWHLIAEWGVSPRSDGWQNILGESIEGFDERRTAR